MVIAANLIFTHSHSYYRRRNRSRLRQSRRSSTAE